MTRIPSIVVIFGSLFVGLFVIEVSASATTLLLVMAPRCKQDPSDRGGWQVVGSLQGTPDPVYPVGKLDWMAGIPPGSNGYTCRTNVIELSAGNDHRESLFLGIYTTPQPNMELKPGSAKGSYYGRETFSVSPHNVFPHSLLCKWYTKGGPVGGSGGYVNGSCIVRASPCTP
jgi:hypothetical protein